MSDNRVQGPLAGIRVLDFTHVLSGPFATVLLADLGADVVKVERPSRGDTTRGTPPYLHGISHYFVAVNHSVQTALAWKLHVTLERVGTSMRHQGVLFVGPHDTIDGASAPVASMLDRKQLLASVDRWRVYRVWRAPHLNGCVGQ